MAKVLDRIQEGRGSISNVMRGEVVKMILEKFPTLRTEDLESGQNRENGEDIGTELSVPADLFALYPDLQEEITKIGTRAIVIGGADFKRCKKRICFIYGLWNQMQGWDEDYRDQVIDTASNPDLKVAKQDLRAQCKTDGDGVFRSFVKKGKSLLGTSDHTLVESMIRDAEKSPFHGDAESATITGRARSRGEEGFARTTSKDHFRALQEADEHCLAASAE
ncbi:hypothetical protein PAXINDRAFT_157560 [Paxillus involutus ATCC 200175]|uniref:Uncharacterized protein n=1 Tax=Paxillus involutus ATCC 200175 TaxID=664439 RepID=A0A0C9SRU8_PAXIN|nr:hypothetical protein PAXINDRAFT_157560 [Paxillus involutus ATCC 200175]